MKSPFCEAASITPDSLDPIAHKLEEAKSAWTRLNHIFSAPAARRQPACKYQSLVIHLSLTNPCFQLFVPLHTRTVISHQQIKARSSAQYTDSSITLRNNTIHMFPVDFSSHFGSFAQLFQLNGTLLSLLTLTANTSRPECEASKQPPE